jgi:hypothetical protein
VSITECIAILKASNIPLEDGLAPNEIQEIERRFGFEFSPDHRQLLESAQPAGTGWLHWRKDSVDRLQTALDWPLEGLLFDVENNEFWPPAWGPKPTSLSDQQRIATQRIKSWPVLIPLFGHRYMPATPAPSGTPVFSIYQSDVIVYGRNLLEYLQHELGPADANFHRNRPFDAAICPPWSLLALGLDISD